MINDSVQDSTRYIVSELHYGSILPGTRMEINRDVFILSNADIKGGIWANDLFVKGNNINVEKSVFCKKNLTIENSENNNNKKGGVNFNSVVVVNESLLIRELPYKISFKSDIYSSIVNIKNSIIYGNIFADNVILENSIVLGGVYVKNSLKVENTILSLFRAKSVELKDNVYLLFPFSIAEEPILIKKPVKALTFYSIYKNEVDKDGGILELDDDDVFKVKDIIETENKEEDVYVLSGNERILDANRIIKSFEFNKQIIEILTLGNHYNKDNKKNDFDIPVDKFENYLWEIIEKKKKLKNINGTTSLKDLFKRTDVLEVLESLAKKD